MCTSRAQFFGANSAQFSDAHLPLFRYAITEDCAWRKITAAGWVSTWLWCSPVALDWLLLLMHHRGTGRARQALLRWSHLVWPLAVVLSLPLLLPLQPPAAAVPSPTLLPHCILPASPPAYRQSFLGTLGAFALCFAFNAAIYAYGLLRASSEAPLVVWRRQRRRAAALAAAWCVLHPPNLAYYYYTAHLSQPPPALLAYWAALAGAPWQGTINALAHLASEPSLTSRLRAALCAAPHEAPQIAHADSRHVHFVPDEVHENDSSFWRASGGRASNARASDAVLRVLAEQRAAGNASFRWWWCALPVAAIGVVVTVVLLIGHP